MNSVIITFYILSLVIYQTTCIIVNDFYPRYQVHSLHDEKTIDYYAHPRYSYKYGVRDYHTGDLKSVSEQRDGDQVQGQYTLAEPDGTLRVVEYAADDRHGFNAVVKKIGQSSHPVAYQEHHQYQGSYEAIH